MKAAREINEKKLDDFGPFAYAMNQIMLHGETNKNDDQKATLGVTLHDPEAELTHELGTWASSEMLYRGTALQ